MRILTATILAIGLTAAMAARCLGDNLLFAVPDNQLFVTERMGNDLFDVPESPDKQILLFLSDDCPPCVAIRENVIPAMERTGWTFGETGHVKLFDSSAVEFRGYNHGNGVPLAVMVENGREQRRIEPGCTLAIDSWSLYWLYTGEHHSNAPARKPLPAKVARTGLYPLRGGWWTVDGQTRPTREYLIEHLDDGRFHDDKFRRAWLSRLSYAELHSLHSDDHEGRVQWKFVNRPQQEPLREGLSRRTLPPRTGGLLRSLFVPRRQYVCPTCPNYGGR